MIMRQTFFSLLLALLMSTVATQVLAHDISVKNENGVTIYYTYINNNTELEVSKWYDYQRTYDGSVVIPESVTYNGKTYSVTSIGNGFSGCTFLTSVTIPGSVTNIGDGAFSECVNLKSIDIQRCNGHWYFCFLGVQGPDLCDHP